MPKILNSNKAKLYFLRAHFHKKIAKSVQKKIRSFLSYLNDNFADICFQLFWGSLGLTRSSFLNKSTFDCWVFFFFWFSFSWSLINCSIKNDSKASSHELGETAKFDFIMSFLYAYSCVLWLVLRYFSLMRKIAWPIRLFLAFDKPFLFNYLVLGKISVHIINRIPLFCDISFRSFSYG